MKNYTSFNFAVLGIFSGLSLSFLFLLPVVIFSYWYFVKKNLSANLIKLSSSSYLESKVDSEPYCELENLYKNSDEYLILLEVSDQMISIYLP